LRNDIGAEKTTAAGKGEEALKRKVKKKLGLGRVKGHLPLYDLRETRRGSPRTAVLSI